MLFLAFLLTALAYAAPNVKRALSFQDIETLQLANYIENLEYALFIGGCNGFGEADFKSAGFASTFRTDICAIAQQSNFKITAISELLELNSARVVPPCTYNFPYTNTRSFVTLANEITTVAIGAYIATVKAITGNGDLRATLASILAVEARHDAVLRLGLDLLPFPTTFDTALSDVWAYNLAKDFTVSCPVPLNYIDLPSLNLVGPTAGPVAPGTPITFSWNPDSFITPISPTTPLYMAGVAENATDPTFGPVTKINPSAGTIEAPADFPSGVVFLCLTTFSGGLTLSQLTDFGTLAGPLTIMIS